MLGNAIGSLVSVTVFKLVMDDVERKALASLSVPVLFWEMDVDNTCTTIAHELLEQLAT